MGVMAGIWVPDEELEKLTADPSVIMAFTSPGDEWQLPLIRIRMDNHLYALRQLSVFSLGSPIFFRVVRIEQGAKDDSILTLRSIVRCVPKMYDNHIWFECIYN